MNGKEEFLLVASMSFRPDLWSDVVLQIAIIGTYPNLKLQLRVPEHFIYVHIVFVTHYMIISYYASRPDVLLLCQLKQISSECL